MFQYHKVATQYWGELAWRLIDSAMFPMRATDYSVALESYANSVIEKYGEAMRQHGLTQSIGRVIKSTFK